MLQYLTDLIGRTGHWAYLILFLGATLESAAFLGLIVPGESLVLVAGFFAAQGSLDLDVLIVVVGLGAALGDSIGYEMGRWMGRPALEQYGGRFGLTQASIDKSDAFFDRHGSKAVFLGRFVGFARALVPFLAGSSQMAYRRFLPYNIAGALLWATAVTLLGYFLGSSWEKAGRWLGQASALLGGLLLFVFMLIWLWRWAVKNELLIRRGWSHFLEHKTVNALRMRLAPQLAFVKARLSRSGYLGLQLTSGALALIGASWLFGGVAEDVVHGDPLTLVDVQVAQWFHEHATPFVTQIMLAITHLHDPLPVTIAVALIASYLAWKRNWYWLTCLVLTVPFGMLLNVVMKYSFHRARPSFENPLLVESSYSFPSGHVAGATLFYGFLAAMVIAQIESWRWRVMIVLGAIAVVVLVALTRMYLGVHYLSDVLAAFAEGIAWLALCLTGMNTFWRSTSLQRQNDANVAQRRELQESLQTVQQRFTHELEQQRLASSSLEERHATEMRRLLLDVDRERVHATTLQKDVAMCQRVQADQTELHLQQVAEKQAQTEELRQRNGELEGSLAELRGQHEQLLRDMADVRSRLKANRL